MFDQYVKLGSLDGFLSGQYVMLVSRDGILRDQYVLLIFSISLHISGVIMVVG